MELGIIVTQARLRRVAGKLDVVNHVTIYILARPWLISVSQPLGKSD